MIGGLPSVDLYCVCILSIETFMLLACSINGMLGYTCKIKFFDWVLCSY